MIVRQGNFEIETTKTESGETAIVMRSFDDIAPCAITMFLKEEDINTLFSNEEVPMSYIQEVQNKIVEASAKIQALEHTLSLVKDSGESLKPQICQKIGEIMNDLSKVPV